MAVLNSRGAGFRKNSGHVPLFDLDPAFWLELLCAAVSAASDPSLLEGLPFPLSILAMPKVDFG